MFLFVQLLLKIVSAKHIAVFDCGSSGTRVLLINYTDTNNVYSFKQFAENWDSYYYCSNRTRKMTTPEAKEALTKDIYRILIKDGINKLVPTNERKNVPLLFYHTAGMRELSESVQNEINDYMCEYFQKNTEYDVQRKNFKVLAGWEESLYQWLTVNQVMGYINSESTMPILHMGGESMQFGLELREPPEDDFMKSFVYTVRLNGKYHYIFLYSWLKYGTGAIADISHVDRVNAGIMESPCMYKGGIYEIEVHSKEHPEGGYYYPLKGTGNFEECANLMKPVFTETKDLSKCHGYSPTVSDYLKDNCIPFADKFEHLYGGSCVGDALRYLKFNISDEVAEPLTYGQLVSLNKEYAKTSYKDVLDNNGGDENAEWTMSNAAMVKEFMNKAFCKPENLGEAGLNNIEMYYKDTYEGKLQAWNLGAAIAYESDGFQVIMPENYKESWFTAGRIAGITVGCVAFVGIIVGVIIFLVIRKRRQNDDVQLEDTTADQVEKAEN